MKFIFGGIYRRWGLKYLLTVFLCSLLMDFMQNTWDFPHSGLNLHTDSIECQVVHEVKLKNCQS